MTFPPLIIWAKALFFFEQLFPVVARTWFPLRSVFFWAQNLGFWSKNPIFKGDAGKKTLAATPEILLESLFMI